ncbi:MAG TPA: hypothetical protein VIL13_10070 [Longimicrobiales bacterium]
MGVSISWRGPVVGGAALVLILSGARASAAQDLRWAPRFPPVSTRPDSVVPVRAPGKAFLASAAVPGAGQRWLGLGRWVPYTALEAWGWITYLDRRGEARELERRYRDLAWYVARRVSVGPRRENPSFEYYEAMGQYSASGAFDRDPGREGIQPEEDPTTYNGMIWDLARAIYFPAGRDSLPPDAPEYQAALAYYRQRATPPEFAWAWGENGLEQRVYAELIAESDEAFRSARRALGLILANHVISAVDAFITARMRAAGREELPLEMRSWLEPEGGDVRWTGTVEVRWPRR